MTYQLPTPTPTYAPQTHPLAIFSLLASIAGLTILPAIGSLVGVVLGHISHHEIQTQPETYTGNGWAVSGAVLGWLGLLLPAVGAIVSMGVVLFFFGGLAAFMLFLGLN